MTIEKEKEHLMQLEFEKLENFLMNTKAKEYKKLTSSFKRYLKDAEKKGYEKTIKGYEYYHLKDMYSKITKSLKLDHKKIGSVVLKRNMKNIDAFISKVNLDMLKQTDIDIKDLEQLLIDGMQQHTKYEDYTLAKTKGIVVNFTKPDLKRINKIINKKFHGKHFSDRMWSNKNHMVSSMKNEMIKFVLIETYHLTQVHLVKLIDLLHFLLILKHF